MFDFKYFTPTKVVFGKNTEAKVAELIEEFGGTKVLIHYGGGSVVRSGLLKKVTDTLDAAEISYVTLGGAVPNPRLSLVYEGIELCKKENVDFLLAVGGGSAIDSAKAIGYGVANEGDVWDFYDYKRKPAACLPLGVILTIAATGSEMSDSSVITKEEGLVKRGCNSDYSRAKFAIMNPELTMTLPDYQTACGCTDIMMHTMERYFTNGGNMEITDALAEGLLRTVKKNALILYKDPKNYDARAEVMWAGSLSHNGLTGCGNDGGDWMTHKMEHELGGLYDVAHGAGLAAIWGSWARYVYKNCLHRFKKFALNVMEVENTGTDEEIALRGIEAMEDFYRSIEMPTNLRELGVQPTEDELKDMAHKCAVGVGGAKGSAKVLDEAAMLEIFKASM
ncbi:iron-containing alcohol dehydrogenase [Butyrivibrio sp. DSM 10294]|uniref:iron-containing alcohol dehydrogenase n=1 Tax=Butyrivibrio sp. DSM 10294 TaxID=2972457 RepID=UPI00234F7537|nr:iron-containing alcohol dehydrogenase [Butyrivibrio sp. DSM 10294]MDC7292612.1 iron-containing alcohol dehydrogenase [Butyrivibrio sp. DSM 10294]